MKRNKFSLSHYKLMSTKMGVLCPITWFEVLPGDTVQHSTTALVRCAPLVTPAMHPCHIRIHHFFVPNRIIWQGSGPTGSSATGGFENFITGGKDGMDTTAHPYVVVNSNASIGSLFDYLGLPTAGQNVQYNANALPIRAYQLIWNEFFRDQDLQTAAVVSTADGADTTTSTSVQNVCWEKDYLTTTRPWEEKGPSVSMFPAGSNAPVLLTTGSTATTGTTYPGAPATAANSASVAPTQAYTAAGDAAVAGTAWVAAFGQASNSDINQLRHQFAIQRFQEARARWGSRYVEYLRYLGIRSADARLQRPEYLGGGRSTIQFSEVLNTTSTSSASMYGHGIAGHRTNRYRRFFEEHGIVMSLLSVRPITMYTNAMQRRWMRGMTAAGGSTAPAGLLGTKEDYFMRELQGIGQQQTNAAEVDLSAGIGSTFGYQDRYDEYRRQESQVTGQFRSTLDSWHFSREFGSPPSLNSTFVSCVPRTTPFADTSNDNLYIMANHSIQARRMMAKSGGSSFVR